MSQFTKARKDLVSSPFISKLDSKGRITIPSYIRKRLNISKNSKIFVSVSKPRKIEKIKIKDTRQLKNVIQNINSPEEIFLMENSFLLREVFRIRGEYVHQSFWRNKKSSKYVFERRNFFRAIPKGFKNVQNGYGIINILK